VATVTLETAHSSEVLADACAEALGSWRAALAEALRSHGMPESEAASLAALMLAAIEGALIMARAERAVTPLELVGDELAALLRARIG